MKKIYVGDKLQIQCYKHNGKPHRAWDEAIVLDVKKDYIVLGNNRATVINSDGNVWKTREPDIMYFFKEEWFNIIAQLKNDGIYFKCNIASPFIVEEETVKWIDYDLDLRVFQTGAFKILDRDEYNYNKNKMAYSEKLEEVIKGALTELIEMVRKKEFPFNKDIVEKYYEKYKKM